MSDRLDLVRTYEPVLRFSKDGEGNPEGFLPLAAGQYVHECGLRRRRQGWEHPLGKTLLKHLSTVQKSKECYLVYAADDLPGGDIGLRLLDQGLELSRVGDAVMPEVPLSRESMNEWLGWAAEDPTTKSALETTLGVQLTPDVLRGGPQALAIHRDLEERRPDREEIEWLGELDDPSATAALEAILGASPADVLEAGAGALAAHRGLEEPAAGAMSITAKGFADLPHSVLKRAQEKYRPVRESHSPVYHYHVCNSKGYRVLQYWFLYAFNDWAAHGGYNDHEGDWEVVCVFLDAEDKAQWVAASRHVLKPHVAKWSDLLERDGAVWLETHPVVYVGCGSHANYLERKSYGYWLGCTYYDYAKGNDVAIGPPGSGADHKWGDPIRLDNKPWNQKFAGNWGALPKSWLGLPVAGAGGPTGPAQKHNKWNHPAKWAGIRRSWP